MMIGEIENEKTWRFTGFYGDPDTKKNQGSWDMLCLLKNNSTLPRLCVGDFNEIVSDEKKMRGVLCPTK